MIRIESLQINLNKILLLAIGLWPYQQSKLVRAQLIVLFGILITFIIFQLTVLVTSKCTPEVLINVFSSILFLSVSVLKYSSFSNNTEIMQHLLEQLQHIYNELTDKTEITIIRKYGRYAEYYTIIFTAVLIFFTSFLMMYQLFPRILDILLPLNESRSHFLLLPVTEYFIDQERYFYLIMIHANMAFFIGNITIIATGSILLVCILYACGMFRIASYRIEHAMTIDISNKDENIIYKKLIYAVDMHRKAMKFSDSSISRFKIMFFFLIVIGIICASLNFFRIFQAILLGYEFKQFSLPVLFVTIHFLYMLVGNIIAQQIMDHNNDMFISVYNVPWYLAPLRVQKMILFLLQKSIKVFNLNIAGLFVGSLEGAATLLSTSISYFTVLYSVQH
ncbi:Or9e98 [Eciton burchellii]|nr:Or9e98 [Eciton burchellii]